MMLTGDHESSAWRVAKAVGINEVHSNLKPEDKLNHVKKSSRDAGGGLIMVGDGINDAPALAAATVGIVLAQRASATAVAVADVLLLQDNISSVPFCIAKARQTTMLVKQSVTLALSCIIFASLQSVLGFLPLWLTVLLHEGGTLLVCLNSIRALNEPTWSWRDGLWSLLSRLRSILTMLIEKSSRFGGNIQPAPL
ncbi:probable cadmium/zinc-transporting ATPase HMA1, chloroplastic [Phalaenopsis equestris]|uniref:probable cadmium/zinc-transporting ATPase HMA1, chloroplastic n=1 Tax=Phalaenopsis equestris TaxID=78828 RepID=UPI0009E2DD04|nr:probable cadmium/zinc-transporting ATPase HMA1, chloroplastic [Phalaenopsis equestris]